jgi:hypothetical protein
VGGKHLSWQTASEDGPYKSETFTTESNEEEKREKFGDTRGGSLGGRRDGDSLRESGFG